MPEGKGKHLDLEDRIRIEGGLRNKERLSEIARADSAPDWLTH